MKTKEKPKAEKQPQNKTKTKKAPQKEKIDLKQLFNKELMTDTRRTIEKSMTRYISIIAIIALGLSFFAGMNAVSPDMIQSSQAYYKETNLMDLSVQSVIGISGEEINAIASIQGVEAVHAVKSVDGLLKVNGEMLSDIDGSQYTVRALSLNVTDAYNYQIAGEKKSSYMNKVTLLEGAWPTATNECLVDASHLSTPDEFQIGNTVTIVPDKTDFSSKLNTTEYKIVGIIRSPLFVSYERGYTNVGTGKLGAFIYIPEECFTLDYYTAAYVKILGSENYKAYTKSYDGLINVYKKAIEEASNSVLPNRVQTLYNEYSEKVANGRLEYEKAKGDADIQISEAKKQVENVKYLATYGDELIRKLKEQYNASAVEADDALNIAKLQQTTQYAQWEEATKQYNEARALVDQYADAETQYSNALTTYNVANNTVTTARTTVDTLNEAVITGRAAIDQLNNRQDESTSDIISRLQAVAMDNEELNNIIGNIKSFTAVGTAEEISAYMEPQLQSLEGRLKIAQTTLNAADATLKEKAVQLQEAEQLVEKLKAFRVRLSQAEVTLNNAKAALDDAEYQIQFNEQDVMSKLLELKNQISDYEIQVPFAKEKVDKIDEEYEKKVAAVYEQLDKAKYNLEDGENLLENLPNAKWVVSTRDDAVKGYTEYHQTANRMSALAKVFPWLFFIVAAMVCLNTMSRMVEEDRTQIGTLKALGFENNQILVKYLIYSASASIIGSVAGAALGFWIFPVAITAAYSILYDLPSVTLSFRFGYALLGALIAVIVTVVSSYVAVNRSLKEEPSSLMRPKAYGSGKRILLENIDKIWSKLSFSSKVTFRNVFRNKKRFIMVIAGVAGCTALLVAGFGIGDSISATLSNQFDAQSGVCRYDAQIALKNEYDPSSSESEIYNLISSRQEIESAEFMEMKSCIASSSKTSDTMEINLVIPQNPADLNKFVSLESSKSNGYYTLMDQGCIITEKLAKKMKISVGEQITVERDEKSSFAVTVTGIVKNYAFHYVYISPIAYEVLTGETVEYNFITCNFKDGITDDQKNAFASDFVSGDLVSAVAFTSQTIQNLGYIINSLNYVVLVVVVSAALLALIVLYNISNININERFKEIATLKVLGFNKNEVAAYISHENWILSGIGIVIGLILGIPIHRIVITIAEVDIIKFGRMISPLSFLYAAALALLFTLIVNLIMRKHLRRINMVESLKSVE